MKKSTPLLAKTPHPPLSPIGERVRRDSDAGEGSFFIRLLGDAQLSPTPSERPPRVERLTFTLEPAPPFRLDLTAWALRRRPHNAVDRWDGQTYRRVLMLNGKPCEVAVTQIAAPNSPRLRIAVTGA